MEEGDGLEVESGLGAGSGDEDVTSKSSISFPSVVGRGNEEDIVFVLGDVLCCLCKTF